MIICVSSLTFPSFSRLFHWADGLLLMFGRALAALWTLALSLLCMDGSSICPFSLIVSLSVPHLGLPKPSEFREGIRGQDLPEGCPSGRRASPFQASTVPSSLVVHVVSMMLCCAGERLEGKPWLCGVPCSAGNGGESFRGGEAESVQPHRRRPAWQLPGDEVP